MLGDIFWSVGRNGGETSTDADRGLNTTEKRRAVYGDLVPLSFALG